MGSKLVMTKQLKVLNFELEHYERKLQQFCLASEIVFYQAKIKEVQSMIEEVVIQQLRGDEAEMDLKKCCATPKSC
jgi:hypothetical protein